MIDRRTFIKSLIGVVASLPLVGAPIAGMMLGWSRRPANQDYCWDRIVIPPPGYRLSTASVDQAPVYDNSGNLVAMRLDIRATMYRVVPTGQDRPGGRDRVYRATLPGEKWEE